jgi:hypothetical protein
MVVVSCWWLGVGFRVLTVDLRVFLLVVVVDSWLLGVILGVVCCCCVVVACDASRFHFSFSVPSSAYRTDRFLIFGLSSRNYMFSVASLQ